MICKCIPFGGTIYCKHMRKCGESVFGSLFADPLQLPPDFGHSKFSSELCNIICLFCCLQTISCSPRTKESKNVVTSKQLNVTRPNISRNIYL